MYHGGCRWGEVWLELSFLVRRCIRKIIIFQTHLTNNNPYGHRMRHTKVTLKDTEQGRSHLCGTLYPRGQQNGGTLNNTDQAHYIDCEMACGHSITLTVNHAQSNPEWHNYINSCIHIFEIRAYMECPLGQFRNENGQCQECEDGEYNAEGWAWCLPCPEGSQPNQIKTGCGE